MDEIRLELKLDSKKIIGLVHGTVYNTDNIPYQILEMGHIFLDSGWKLENYSVDKTSDKISQAVALFSTEEFEFVNVESGNEVINENDFLIKADTIDGIIDALEKIKEETKNCNANLDSAIVYFDNNKVIAEVLVNEYQNVIKREKIKMKLPSYMA